MLASFVQKCTFCPSSIQRGEESARTIIGSFWGAYREQKGMGEDVELERMVVSHIGAQVAKVPGLEDRKPEKWWRRE